MGMALRHESRLDSAVDAGHFCDGESVEVRTMMGSPVGEGVVLSTTPFGLIVRESSGDTKFYKRDLYLFVSPVVNPSMVVSNELNDQSIDARVRRRLATMGEAGDVPDKKSSAKELETDKEGAKKGGKKGGKKPEDDSEKSDEKDGEDADEKVDKKGDKRGSGDDSSVDVSQLPDDIKGAVSTTNELDDSKVNSIMGEISSAAVKAMKRNDIDETEIFGKVEDIQKAVYKILTGKESSKQSDKKSDKKAKK